jgi:parallel beta-helix repeat protein
LTHIPVAGARPNGKSAFRFLGGAHMNRRIETFVLAVALIAIAAAPSLAHTFGTYISTDTILTDDHDGDIVITADHITLDCGGHVISGDLPVGVRLEGRTQVTVRNCEVAGFVRGFLVLNSVGNTLVGNIANRNQFGFAVAGSSGNYLYGNTANSNEFAGFAPGQSTGNTFAGNTANLNGRNGFEIHLFSNGNVFSENTANNNAATGFALNLSSNNQLSANTANGNAENGFALFQSNGNLLEDNTAIRNAFAGFALSQSGTNTLVGNRAKNNVAGFHLVSSSFNTIESNDGTPNCGIDAFQSGSAGNVYLDNRFKTTDGI